VKMQIAGQWPPGPAAEADTTMEKGELVRVISLQVSNTTACKVIDDISFLHHLPWSFSFVA